MKYNEKIDMTKSYKGRQNQKVLPMRERCQRWLADEEEKK